MPECQTNFVRCDDYQGGYIAGKHLLELGHRHFLYLPGPKYNLSQTRRYAGIMDALSEANVPASNIREIDYHTVFGSSAESTSSYKPYEELFFPVNYTAVIGFNDLQSYSAMEILQKKGYRIPEDISLISFDHLRKTHTYLPPLSSIAAVAQVELITKTPSALSGVRYVINGGVQESLEDMGAPEGTTFLVRNLFYNTPARSKFLKSDTTEGNYVSTLMEQLALSHPEISFKYIQNKQVKLHTSGNYNVKDVIYNIYGRDITKALLEVSYENDFMKIEGFVGKPEISRGNRTFENYYINGRFVKNRIIAKGIEDAYKGFLMQHKFPFVSLHIQMEGNDLDVNVHPSKMEVRFARGTEVYDAVYETVHKALTTRLSLIHI